MDFKTFTPGLRMQCKTVLRRGREWWKDLATEYGVTDNEIIEALDDFVVMSLRLNGSKPKVDFKWVALADDVDKVREKFVAYLNTQTADEVWELETALKAFDAPASPDTAPDEPTDPEA